MLNTTIMEAISLCGRFNGIGRKEEQVANFMAKWGMELSKKMYAKALKQQLGAGPEILDPSEIDSQNA
ncbi:hypothetical protein SUGI_0838000 [Cryptomeria japonica]|nr:hypothetical protein SUGI_0838000 [Cryptomeria japonica]